MRSTNLSLAFSLVLFACSPATQPTQPNPPPYCGSDDRSKPWDADCANRCIPDEQLYVTCTEKLGRVFNTRQGLSLIQSYGWTWETSAASSQRCGDYTARVWKLTPLLPQPTAATVAVLFGRVTTTETSGECSDRVMTSMAVATDRIYYVATEVL